MSDTGVDLQQMLIYLTNTGAPVGSLGGRRKIVGFVETDPRNQDDLRRVIDECGSALVSLNLRANIAPEWEITPDVWEFDPSSPRVGRHCVNFAKYDKDGFYAESWGKNSYLVTPACIADALDESYGVISGAWIEATGRTPLGMTTQELEVQMQGIKRVC